MITDVKAIPFDSPVTATAGDTINVDLRSGYKIDRVIKYDATFTATWTHSISFKLNGETQWIIGTQKTIDWLRSVQNSAPIQRPLTPQEQHAITFGRGGY